MTRGALGGSYFLFPLNDHVFRSPSEPPIHHASSELRNPRANEPNSLAVTSLSRSKPLLGRLPPAKKEDNSWCTILTLGALSPVANGDSTDALASGLLKKRF